MDDWRLNGQERYLACVKLKRVNFLDIFHKSDHEHCEFCMEKISTYPDTIHEAYCTLDEYHWICEDCFNDFRDLFHWVIV